MIGRHVELFLYLAGVTILTPLLTSMGVPWSLRIVIYLAPASIILLYRWHHGSSTRAKADEELMVAVGSAETVNVIAVKIICR